MKKQSLPTCNVCGLTVRDKNPDGFYACVISREKTYCLPCAIETTEMLHRKLVGTWAVIQHFKREKKVTMDTLREVFKGKKA